MLTEPEAVARAAEFLAAKGPAWSKLKMRVIPELTFGHEGKFIVPYDSVAFLDEGDEGARMGGNMPIRVDGRTGECETISVQDVVTYLELGIWPEE